MSKHSDLLLLAAHAYQVTLPTHQLYCMTLHQSIATFQVFIVAVNPLQKNGENVF